MFSLQKNEHHRSRSANRLVEENKENYISDDEIEINPRCVRRNQVQQELLNLHSTLPFSFRFHALVELSAVTALDVLLLETVLIMELRELRDTREKMDRRFSQSLSKGIGNYFKLMIFGKKKTFQHSSDDRGTNRQLYEFSCFEGAFC